MNTIVGKYNTAVIYTDNIEESAVGQIQQMCDFEPLKDSHIRIMPDVHAGKGCTIGTTMEVHDKVVPNMVGVDISCGILTVSLKDEKIDLPRLDTFIHKNIPCGREINKRPVRGHGRLDMDELLCLSKLRDKKLKEAICSVGSGNHFISVEQDDEGVNYLLIHSGSRNPGKQTAEYYQNVAYKRLQEQGSNVPFELAYLEGEDFDNYIHDMHFMQKYAELNRRCIADAIIEGLDLTEDYRFDTTHNYIDTEHMILRKGACAAYEGDLLIVPMNMRDGSLICRGKGNPEWNYSAPHGAGRVMSRKDAKNTLSMQDYKNSMEGIYTTCVSHETIDEAPMAYKSMDDIVSQIANTVEIVKHIKPIYNFKAKE